LQIVEAEECLRSLADEALREAEAGALVLHCTLGVRATANAFVLLGLIPESRADNVVADYESGLQDRSLGTAWGLTDGELPARSGAGEVWEAHAAGPVPLHGVPQAMAPASVAFPASVSGLKADLRFEWVKLAGDEWRLSFRASAEDPGGEPDRPSVVMREALALFKLTDDAGHRYRPRVEGVTWERVAPGRQEWRGDLVAGQSPDNPRPAWLEIASLESGTAERVELGAAHDRDAGAAGAGSAVAVTARARWTAPAEGYLAALASIGGVKVGWTDIEAAKTAEIVAVVADCLLAVGALPPSSDLLRDGLRPGLVTGRPPAWRDALAARWARRAQLDAGREQVLLAELPFGHASAVIESVRATGWTVGVTLHGRPWVAAAPWPVITPCFTVSATDEDGNAYEGVLDGFRAERDTTGTGTFWLWPPVPEGARSLTVTVGTLWEAAQVKVEITASGAPRADGSA
jgi:hypothetical protein